MEALLNKNEAHWGPEALSSARFIIGVGRGLGTRQAFLQAQNLADRLGAAIGGTRGALDEGWITHEQEIGLSGKRVHPELYLACGISGANFHTLGIEQARYIIAINPDPEARIHTLAHLSVAADANTCIKALWNFLDATRFDKNSNDAIFLVKEFFQRTELL